VHGLGIDVRGRPFFAMTRLRGSSLAGILERRRKDPEVRRVYGIPRLMRILLQVGYALAFAHSRGVLHRDIKPENVIVGEFGEVRLMDWGIAMAVKGVPHLGAIFVGSLVLCAAIMIPPFYTLLRKPRPDDPGALVGYGAQETMRDSKG
jgi:serine/threonine protein kinase